MRFVEEALTAFDKNSIVLDTFVGSGTTIIAAEKRKQICYAMEIDPTYCDVVIERWQQYTGKKAYRLHDEIYFDDLKENQKEENQAIAKADDLIEKELQ
jgi:DNA modification methylase